MRALILALQFLTIVPWWGEEDVSPAQMGRSTAFFPLVGAALGTALSAFAWGAAYVLPHSVVAVLVLALWVILTGALHLDGFLDTCDGLFGGHTPDARLHIMRDERVGAFALAGGVLLLLTKYTALAALLSRSQGGLPSLYPLLILPPTLGRFAMTLAIVAFPYARAEGLGRWMKDWATYREVVLAAGTGAAVAVLLQGKAGLPLLAGTILLTYLLGRFTMRRIPGLTGDVYGAVCELVETGVLLVFVTIGT